MNRMNLAAGWAAVRKNWESDMLASIVVFLVALPLCMRIAISSGVPTLHVMHACGGAAFRLSVGRRGAHWERKMPPINSRRRAAVGDSRQPTPEKRAA